MDGWTLEEDRFDVGLTEERGVMEEPRYAGMRNLHLEILAECARRLRHVPTDRAEWMRFFLDLLWVSGAEAPLTFERVCVCLGYAPVIAVSKVEWAAEPSSLQQLRRKMIAVGYATLRRYGAPEPESLDLRSLQRTYRWIKFHEAKKKQDRQGSSTFTHGASGTGVVVQLAKRPVGRPPRAKQALCAA